MAKMACGHESLSSWVEDADTRIPYCMECGWDSLGGLTAQVTDWHKATFGEPMRWKALAAKLREEANELAEIMEKWGGMCAEVMWESADIQIILCAIAGRNEFDLMTEARKKLQIVKCRDQKTRDLERGIPA